MDRGIPTEKTLAALRVSNPPIHYLVGTPKASLGRFEAALSERSGNPQIAEVGVIGSLEKD